MLHVAAGAVGPGCPGVVDGEGVVAVVELHVQERQVHRHVGRRRVPPPALERRFIEPVGVGTSKVGVVVVAVAGIVTGRQPEARIERRQGPGHHRVDRACAVVTDAGTEARAGRLPGVCTAHVDEAGQRVRPVARRLRSAQDLDAIDIEQGRRTAQAAEVHVVDQEADRCIRRTLVLLELADPAELKVARP